MEIAPLASIDVTLQAFLECWERASGVSDLPFLEDIKQSEDVIRLLPNMAIYRFDDDGTAIHTTLGINCCEAFGSNLTGSSVRSGLPGPLGNQMQECLRRAATSHEMECLEINAPWPSVANYLQVALPMIGTKGDVQIFSGIPVSHSRIDVLDYMSWVQQRRMALTRTLQMAS